MGLMSFLHFSFDYCVTFLALPLLALVYPLCASIRAIETNSFSDIQTLNVYWVVLSLMLLLEHGFMKLFGWSLSWQYIRIAIVCLLVIPYFDGALYVYKCFIRLLLSVDPQILINWFKTHKESQLARENFLDELDRYVKENGTEAVEKILTGKSYSREPDVSHEDIESLEVTEKKEVLAMDQDQSYMREPDVSHEDIKSLEVTIKKEVMTMDQDQSYSREPDVSHEGIKSLEVTEKEEVMTMDQDQVCQVERNITWTNVSCDVSHETTQRETTSHSLRQRARMRAMERMRAVKKASSDIQIAENGTMPTRENVQVQFNSVSGSSATKSKENTVETAKAPLSSGKKQIPSTMDKEKIEKQNKKIPNKQCVEMKAAPNKQSVEMNAPIWCHVCKISCPGVVGMRSHLQGRKHIARIRSTIALPVLTLNKEQ